MLRFGCQKFLNALPILRGLEADSGEYALTLDRPSRLARMLHERQLDVAMVPAIEYLRNPDYVIVPDVCIAAIGKVGSVNLYCRKPPDEIGFVALDPSSLTGVMLVKVLMLKRFGVRPRYFVAGHVRLRDLSRTEADAVLVIGDEALGRPPAGYQVLDLAEQWFQMTALPFVFAVCCTHRGTDLGGFDKTLKASLAKGLGKISEIAAEAAPGAGLTKERLESYLAQNIRYNLGPAEIQGLRCFFKEVVEANLWTEERDIEFYHG
jgi:chorismate dehydratase